MRQPKPGCIGVNGHISIHALTRSATRRIHRFQWSVDISIHALTRSATSNAICEREKTLISIHALTRSATSYSPGTDRYHAYFNPRTHEECDGLVFNNLLCGCDFNPRTHEECDYQTSRLMSAALHFNPRTHEECDDVDVSKLCSMEIFQSTHSRGVRLF